MEIVDVKSCEYSELQLYQPDDIEECTMFSRSGRKGKDPIVS